MFFWISIDFSPSTYENASIIEFVCIINVGLGLNFNPYFLKTLLGFCFLLVCLSLRMDDHALLMSMLMGSLDLTGRLVLRFAKHVLQ